MPGIAELSRRKKTKYNVVVSDGLRGRKYPVKEFVAYNEGYVLRYKNGDGQMDVVYAGPKYRPLEVDGEYWVGKRTGNNSACYIDYEGIKVKEACEVVGPSIDPDCPGEDLSSLVRTDVLAIGYHTLTEAKKVSWKVIIIIGIIVVAVVVFMYIRSRGGA